MAEVYIKTKSADRKCDFCIIAASANGVSIIYMYTYTYINVYRNIANKYWK